jgi:hypothetical protein
MSASALDVKLANSVKCGKKFDKALETEISSNKAA